MPEAPIYLPPVKQVEVPKSRLREDNPNHQEGHPPASEHGQSSVWTSSTCIECSADINEDNLTGEINDDSLTSYQVSRLMIQAGPELLQDSGEWGSMGIHGPSLKPSSNPQPVNTVPGKSCSALPGAPRKDTMAQGPLGSPLLQPGCLPATVLSRNSTMSTSILLVEPPRTQTNMQALVPQMIPIPQTIRASPVPMTSFRILMAMTAIEEDTKCLEAQEIVRPAPTTLQPPTETLQASDTRPVNPTGLSNISQPSEPSYPQDLYPAPPGYPGLPQHQSIFPLSSTHTESEQLQSQIPSQEAETVPAVSSRALSSRYPSTARYKQTSGWPPNPQNELEYAPNEDETLDIYLLSKLMTQTGINFLQDEGKWGFREAHDPSLQPPRSLQHTNTAPERSCLVPLITPGEGAEAQDPLGFPLLQPGHLPAAVLSRNYPWTQTDMQAFDPQMIPVTQCNPM